MQTRQRPLKRRLRHDSTSAAAAVGTVMLVVVTVALVGVVGMFLFTLVNLPEDPPELKVSYIKVAGRWTVSITDVSDELDISGFRILAKNSDGEYISYDTTGDATVDSLLISDLDLLTVLNGGGPQHSPLVLVDSDGDGRVDVGDSFVVLGLYYYPAGPLLDADRGYKYVAKGSDAIPRDSNLQLIASPETLGSSDINPGDEILIEIHKDGDLKSSTTGYASLGGTFEATVWVEPGWEKRDHRATFTVRPGEVDEWSHVHDFKVIEVEPIGAAEAEAYYKLSHPFHIDDLVTVVHKASNAVVLEFTL